MPNNPIKVIDHETAVVAIVAALLATAGRLDGSLASYVNVAHELTMLSRQRVRQAAPLAGEGAP